MPKSKRKRSTAPSRIKTKFQKFFEATFEAMIKRGWKGTTAGVTKGEGLDAVVLSDPKRSLLVLYRSEPDLPPERAAVRLEVVAALERELDKFNVKVQLILSKRSEDIVEKAKKFEGLLIDLLTAPTNQDKDKTEEELKNDEVERAVVKLASLEVLISHFAKETDIPYGSLRIMRERIDEMVWGPHTPLIDPRACQVKVGDEMVSAADALKML